MNPKIIPMNDDDDPNGNRIDTHTNTLTWACPECNENLEIPVEAHHVPAGKETTENDQALLEANYVLNKKMLSDVFNYHAANQPETHPEYVGHQRQLHQTPEYIREYPLPLAGQTVSYVPHWGTEDPENRKHLYGVITRVNPGGNINIAVILPETGVATLHNVEADHTEDPQPHTWHYPTPTDDDGSTWDPHAHTYRYEPEPPEPQEHTQETT